MKEARDLFYNYYYTSWHEATDVEESNDENKDSLLDKYIEWDGEDHAKETIKQLSELIDSSIEDDELRILIHEKLGSDFFAEPGGSREWLQYICKYLKEKT